MGTAALAHLAALGIVPKNRTITSMRLPHCVTLPSGAKLAITYSAAILDREYDKHIDTLIDVSLVMRYLKTGTFEPALGKYRYVKDFSEARAHIEEEFSKTKAPVAVALDTETLGLDPLSPSAYLITIQIAYEQACADVIYFPNRITEVSALKSGPVRESLEWLLTTPMVSLRAANGKYDLNWIWYRGAINCTNFKLDTMLVGSLLDENRGNSLNLHAKIYTSIGGYDDGFNVAYDKSRMDLVPVTDLLTYAAGDADACRRTATRMKFDLMRDKSLCRFYINVLHPAARAYESVERVGVLVDVPYYFELEHEIKSELDRLHKEAISIIGGRIVARHLGNLNLTKASLLCDLFFSPMGFNLTPLMRTGKTGAPSTSIDHLMMFKEDERAAPFLKLLEEYQSAQKTLSTYVCKRDEDGKIVGGFLSHLRTDGRFHPTYFLFNGGGDDGGTNTGRLSARDPAFQTVPKRNKWAKKLRRAFVAPPGMMVLSCDYSQGELKIAACLANEDTMIETYRQGMDLHALTAARLAGWELDEFLELEKTDPDKYEGIRYLGKAGNFGLIYGMGAEGFQNYAKLNYGVNMDIEEATKSREAFFSLYSKLSKWHHDYKAFATQHSYVRSPLGRVRHLPLIRSTDREMASKAGRQAVNAPVQSTLSDMSLWATALLHQSGQFDKAPVIGMVHDQLLSYVPEEDAKAWGARTKWVMENLPFKSLGWTPQLKFTVDVELGPNMGEMKKQKGVTYEDGDELITQANKALNLER